MARIPFHLASGRRFRVLAVLWRRRILFLAGGLVVGAAAVGLAVASDFAQASFRRMLALSFLAPFLLAPAGFALAAYLTRRFFVNSQGSGIPQAIAARQFTDHQARARLVSGRIAVGKIVLTLLGLFCGASIGREGPTVQVGASVMFMAGHFSPSRQAGLILAGSAAGVAAAFNAPLAGVVFAIEEMSRSFELKTSSLVLGAIIASGLVAQALLGNYTYFGATPAALNSGADWLAVPVCGVLGGFAGGLFSQILIAVAAGIPGALGRFIKSRPIVFAAVCGFLTALCGALSGGATYGTGYAEAEAMLTHAIPPVWQFGLAKFIATTLSAISGIPGGIFSPSLAVGAGLGANISALLPHVPFDAVVLLGMVSYFTGVVQAPITAFVIVTEMTDNHEMLVPLMCAALIARASSQLICREGVYHALSRNFLSIPRGD